MTPTPAIAQLTPAELDALEALHREATPGPWEVTSAPWVGLAFGVCVGHVLIAACREPLPNADALNARAIVAAVNALPALLAMARECLLHRDAQPMLDGWRYGLERERDEARQEVLRLRAAHDAALAEISGTLTEIVSTLEAESRQLSTVTAERDAMRTGAPPRSGIYVASKSYHGHMWQYFRDEYPIVSTWIDECEEGQTKSFADLYSRAVREASKSAALVLYIPIGDAPKGGCYIELGAALSANVPVFAYAPGASPKLLSHPLITHCSTIEEAMDQALLAARAWTDAEKEQGR